MNSETSAKVSSEEEIELRDLIMQNLENCGFLNKVKAELRAGVFLAMEEDGNLKNKIPLVNEKLENFISTTEGKLIVSLIREFFEFLNLNFTLSVFEPEVAATVPRISRSELCNQINIKDSMTDCPVMSCVLKEVIGTQNKKLPNKSIDADSLFEKSSLDEDLMKEKSIKDVFQQGNAKNKEKSTHSTSEKDSIFKNLEDTKHDFSSSETVFKSDGNDKQNEFALGMISKEKSDEIKEENSASIYKESNDQLSMDVDPFFDVPVPSEKSSFFTFSDVLKDKPESKPLSSIEKDSAPDTKKNSLSSLRDLPSLTSNEWTFSRDPKNTLPSLDSLKSVSSSEGSKEEIINLDYRDDLERKNSDVVESNEDTSEKQNSDESIEEELDEDSSVNIDELINSSLSLGEDQTTDQTVSQVSIVKGADHVEST